MDKCEEENVKCNSELSKYL